MSSATNNKDEAATSTRGTRNIRCSWLGWVAFGVLIGTSVNEFFSCKMVMQSGLVSTMNAMDYNQMTAVSNGTSSASNVSMGMTYLQQMVANSTAALGIDWRESIHATNQAAGDRNWTQELMDLVGSNNHAEHDAYCRQKFKGGIAVRDKILPESITHSGGNIPKIIHITSKDRCVTKDFYEGIERWKNITDYSFYFHDDEAVHKLMRRHWPELPNMGIIAACAKGGAGLADIWRYLVIYEYGGMYTDIDNLPGGYFSPGSTAEGIRDDYEAVFEKDKGGWASQYWYAAMPKHPSMFFAVHAVFKRLYDVDDYDGYYVPYITGPGALALGVAKFGHGAIAWKPKIGHYVGHGNYTLEIVPRQKFVKRSALAHVKGSYFKKAGIENYQGMRKAGNTTCFSKTLEAAGDFFNHHGK